MKLMAETKSYILIKCPPDVCRGEAKSLADGVRNIMEFYEKLEEKGLIPLDYVRNAEGVLCKKTDKWIG